MGERSRPHVKSLRMDLRSTWKSAWHVARTVFELAFPYGDYWKLLLTGVLHQSCGLDGFTVPKKVTHSHSDCLLLLCCLGRGGDAQFTFSPGVTEMRHTQCMWAE